MKEMSMPELGQGMDTSAAEAAELELAIQQQLDAITLDDQDEEVEDEEIKAPDVEEPDEMLDSMQTYLDVLKTQTLRFEEELQECDEILVDIETARTARDKSSEEEKLLFEIASELGEDPSTLKDRVLAELEEEELKDKSHVTDIQPMADDQPESNGKAKDDTVTVTGAEPAAEVHTDPGDAVVDSSISVETAGVSGESESVQLETEDQSTVGVVEETVTEQNVTSKTSEDVTEGTSDSAVTTEGPSGNITLKPSEGVVAVVLDTDLLERQIQEELRKLDDKFDKREEKRKQGLASRQELEDREEEKRNERRKQIQEEEQKLALSHQEKEKKVQEEADKAQRQMEEYAKIFEAELQELSEQNRKDQEDLRRQQEEQKQQEQEKRDQAALKIQTTYRGYRARKEHGPVLTEKIVERKRKLEEARIQNIEQERQREAEEKHAAEEQERQIKEDEKRKKLEEENKKKAEEKRLKEEAEKKKKEEARRLKEEEEKRRKEEERKQKEEAEKRKREEEKRQKEEAERKRKEEEKRLKEEAEKQRKEEEKRLKEEAEKKKIEQEAEKKRKEEEREDERKREAQTKKEDEEKKKKEELERKMKEGQQRADSDGKDINESIQITKELEQEITRTKEEQNNRYVSKNMKEETKDGMDDKAKASTISGSQVAPQEGSTAISMKQDGTTKAASKHNRKAQPAKHEDLGKDIERRRMAWMKSCTPWSKVSHEVKVNKKPGRRAPRRPSSAKKLPPLTDQQIFSAAGVSALQQVKTVQLEDLPGNGHNISSLAQCPQLRALSITSSPLGFVDDLQTCKNLKFIKLVNTKIEMVNLKDLPNLFYVDLSNNSLSSIHGFEGCDNLRYLNLSHNKITRIGGLDGLKKLHTLNVSHNQLITSRGVGEASALQVLDLSHNHLPIVDDIDKLCLLQHLTASSNNLLEVPKLSNHVLLSHLVLDDNSISFIDSLSRMWLPLLETISLNNNSITQLTDLRHLLLLKTFQLAHNQILDTDEVSTALGECCSLENLSFSGNPLADEPNYRDEVLGALPQLHYLDGDVVCAGREDGERSRPQYTSTYLSQLSQQQKLLQAYHKALEKHKTSGNQDLQKLYHIHLSYLDKSHKMAVEHRYAHEYGDSDAGSAASSSMDFAVTMATSQDFGAETKPSQEDYKKTTQSMKNMFDAAVSKAQSEVAVNQASVHKRPDDQNSNGGPLVPVPPTSPPRVRSATRKVNMHLGQSSPQGSANQMIMAEDQEGLFNTNTNSQTNMNMQRSNVSAKVVGKLLQAEKDSDPTLIRRKESAVRIQAAWRGYLVRRDIDNRAQELFNSAAVMIQSAWRGYWVRKRLQVAKQFMKFDDDDEFGYDEINMDDFVFNEADFENGLVPPKTPQIPSSHPVLGQPLGGQVMTDKPSPLLLYQHPEQPPGPRQAWRNPESPLINTNGQLLGKPPVPPGSRMSSLDTHRTKKSEQLSEEWGFKDSHTAELMMQRARKMKYNAQRKQKMSKLDPKQRLALLRKLEQSTKIRMVRPVARRHLPRKEYFQARAHEEQQKEVERVQEDQEKAQRTFEWLHTQVVHDPDANLDRAKRVSGSESSLPQMDPSIIAGARMQLTGSPASMELQSVESVSLHGDTRRLSLIERPGEKVQLPPIKTSSAPTNKAKERLSWRNPEVNRSGGWGGGKKRSKAK